MQPCAAPLPLPPSIGPAVDHKTVASYPPSYSDSYISRVSLLLMPATPPSPPPPPTMALTQTQTQTQTQTLSLWADHDVNAATWTDAPIEYDDDEDTGYDVSCIGPASGRKQHSFFFDRKRRTKPANLFSLIRRSRVDEDRSQPPYLHQRSASQQQQALYQQQQLQQQQQPQQQPQYAQYQHNKELPPPPPLPQTPSQPAPQYQAYRPPQLQHPQPQHHRSSSSTTTLDPVSYHSHVDEPIRSAPAHMTSYPGPPSPDSPAVPPIMSRARSANYSPQDISSPWNPSGPWANNNSINAAAVASNASPSPRLRQSSTYTPQSPPTWEIRPVRSSSADSPVPQARPRHMGSISDPFDDASQFHLFVEATSGLATDEPAPSFTFTSPQSPPRMQSSLFDHSHQRIHGQRPHSDIFPPTTSAQLFEDAVANVSGDEYDDMPPPDDELPDYAQSQAEAHARVREAATARAAELESRWASSRRWR